MIDYENANYTIRNQDGDERGPFKGKNATKIHAALWQEECEQGITVHYEGDDNHIVASLFPEGQWLFPELRTEDGDHTGEYPEW